MLRPQPMPRSIKPFPRIPGRDNLIILIIQTIQRLIKLLIMWTTDIVGEFVEHGAKDVFPGEESVFIVMVSETELDLPAAVGVHS
ncbi:hypothetical protein BGZ89_010717 [Linnemannia elongata]|nr:hypothetical protein BGZ89_010717 [Linnemannia elongata]